MVSIIIPHFNRSSLLKETIDSVKKQTYTDWEIIIVDDGSAVSEWEQVIKYQEEKIKIFQRTDGEKGPSRCRNIGASKSTGQYLIFLDSDDLIGDICLDQRVAAIEKESENVMVVFLIETFLKTPGDLKENFNINAPFNTLSGLFLQNRNPWQTMAPIWKKTFFEKVGGFCEDLLYMEDPDLHLRALHAAGPKIKTRYDKPADCYYRINHTDTTKQSFWYNSIFYRLRFYRRVTDENYCHDLASRHKMDIKIGIYNLVRVFLYSRKTQFPDLYADLMKLMKESKLFSQFEIARLNYLINIGNSSSWLLRKLRIRGLCFRLLPAK